jgi:nitrogen fixation/metabolism regulation signal transduction histidine kinase
MTLRRRLVGAFLLAAGVPLLLFSWLALARISRGVDDEAEARLGRALAAALARLRELQASARAQVARIAADDLPAARAESNPHLATALAARRGLDALLVLDEGGRVLTSHHWPAGFGLLEQDERLARDEHVWVVRAAAGHGYRERLALLTEEQARWRGQRVLVRGGYFVDEPFLEGLAALLDHDVALVDQSGGRVWSRADSALRDFRGRLDAGGGSAVLRGIRHRWRATPFGRGAYLLVGRGPTPLEATSVELRSSLIAFAAAALAGAAALGFLVSRPLTRRLGALAVQAERVSAGNLHAEVADHARDEVGQLARAMNEMTAELRSAEARLVQASRVAAWRDAARRLAHELKNPLFPIQLSIETLRRAFEKDEAVKSAAAAGEFRKLFSDLSDTILQELRSLRGIVEEFSSFARMPRPQRRATDANAVVERVLELQRPRLAACTVELRLDRELPEVSADPDLLAQALSNLVANALDAMPHGGVLRVATRAEARSIAIEVADSGPGLSDEARRNLFRPYHTTKPAGTGLGLVIVQSIVSDHRGALEVTSEPGRGAVFTIKLPPAAEAGLGSRA